jgi:hypothetical protein
MTPREIKLKKILARAKKEKIGSIRWKKIMRELNKEELIECILAGFEMFEMILEKEFGMKKLEEGLQFKEAKQKIEKLFSFSLN